MKIASGVGAVLLVAAGAQAQLWNTGGFDGVDGRNSDHTTPQVRPDSRAADDFVLPAGNGQAYSITGVRGRALARNYTTAFAEIYTDAGGMPGAAPIATLPQASLSVLQAGVFGQYDLVDVTFTASALSLAPGRYWLSIVCNVSGNPPPGDGYGYFATAGHGVVQGLQGMYRVGTGAWTPVSMAFPNGPSDFSFRIDGQQLNPPPPCYANCDGSTTPPVLNIGDYLCFQAHFVAGDSYANCDHSTNAPILNILDYICFQQHYSAGCT